MSYPTLEADLPRMLSEMWQNRSMFGGTGWVDFEESQFYLRVGPRSLGENNTAIVVTIAHIQTPDEFERKGTFTRMVRAVRRITNWTLFLEGVRLDFGAAIDG